MPRSPAPAIAPITEDDAFIAEALKHASIPTILMSMVHITGGTGILEGPVKPARAILGEGQGGLADEQKAQVRARALEVLAAYRDGGCRLPRPPSTETIHRMMSFMVGEPVPVDYVPMMLEEMALDGVDSRSDGWRWDAPDAEKQDHRVIVIGAGMSGVLTAIRLEQAGIPYTVIEKNTGIGGTWFENTYPGCRVDVANHFYCYSFEPNHDWSEFFSRQQELQSYFERCAQDHDVVEHIRFETEVVSAVFDEATARWAVRIRDADGHESMLDAFAVVSAVGQLNRPKIPEIEGLADFRGPAFHSAQWQHETDLDGKRVAVIGTGASAFQLVKRTSHLVVFQRSPAWMVPNPAYHAKVSDGMKWLLKHVPYYARWYRFLIFWPGSDGLLPSLIVDPDWPHPERSVNELNEVQRRIFSQYLQSQVGDDPELLEKIVPTYPPFGKRMLQDNGSWLATLKRDDVELVAGAATRITHDAVVSEAGESYPVDAIVFATGFHAGRFLWPMDIVGCGGSKLGEVWGDEPRAYLGIVVPGFPNLFCLYGPSTNLAHAGSIIFHSECQVRYVMGCLRAGIEAGGKALECRPAVLDDYDDRLSEALSMTVWAHPAVDSWYKNERGRVITTSPWRLLDYWNWTRDPDLDDFDLVG
jgi:4-hydroxyacetophenone monooxygenase